MDKKSESMIDRILIIIPTAIAILGVIALWNGLLVGYIEEMEDCLLGTVAMYALREWMISEVEVKRLRSALMMEGENGEDRRQDH